MDKKKPLDVSAFPWNPVEFILTNIYSDEIALKDKLQIASQLVKYWYPSKKEFEVRGEQHSELKITWESPAEPMLTIDHEGE